jgi:hypothetical protein
MDEIREGLVSLGITKLIVNSPKIFLVSAKSGPNFPIATLGLGLDLIGFMMRPKK